jgi:cytosine/adenosine deaminase-related metal-dependent hydrolase
MKYITADYIFDGENILNNKILVFNNEGVLCNIEELNVNEYSNVEYYNGLLCPAFVNAHVHLEISFLKGKINRGGGLTKFIEQMRYVNRSNYNIDDIAKADRLMFIEGIIACGDISNQDISFSVKLNSKINYYTFIELYSVQENCAYEVFSKGKQLKQQIAKSSITPHAPYSVSNKLLKLILQEIMPEDIISIHFKESSNEKELFYTFQNSFPVVENPSLYFVSLLPRTNNILFVHNTFISREELDYIEQNFSNPYFVLCPNSNIFIENCLPPLFLINKEKNICIGTDSLASNNSLSIIDELKTLSKTYPEVSLLKWLKMSTLNGAKALKMDNVIGSFEINKKPGAVLIKNLDLVNLKINNETYVERII